jgi:tetratricopeptide (TPR) repeat protein
MIFHSKFIGLLMMVCAIVLSRSQVIAGTLVNNLVAKGTVNELMLVPRENLGLYCGFGKTSNAWSVLADYAKTSVDILPTSGPAWLDVGQVHWAQGRCNEALAAFEKSSELYGTFINPAQFQMARALYTLGEREQSITIFQSIGGARYVAGLADQAQQSGDYRSAITLYALAIEIDPLPQITDGFGLATEKVANLPKASAEGIWRELSLEMPPDQATHWIAVSELALLADDPLAAKDALLRGLELTNDPYYIYLALARSSVKLKDWDGAIANYELALKVKPTANVMPYVEVAQIEATLGNYGQVVAWCDKARSIFPDSHWPDFVQGYAALQLGRLDEAATLFESAHKKAPGDAYSLYYLGSIDEAQNNFLESARYFEQAASVNRVPSETCVWLLKTGDVYQRVGNISKADQIYEKGLTICPDDSTLLDRLGAIRKLEGR